MVNNLEIEIRKQDDGYLFSSEKDGKKRIYIIYSPELRKKLREIISLYWIPSGVNMQYDGKNSQDDRILYQQGKDDLSDQLTLISGVGGGEEQKQKGEEDAWDKWDAEWEQVETLWKKQESELGILSSGTRHYFSGRNSDGKVIVEGTCVKSGNRSQLVILENQDVSNHSSQIQEITDEEAKKMEKDSNNSDENFTQQQEFLPKKN